MMHSVKKGLFLRSKFPQTPKSNSNRQILKHRKGGFFVGGLLCVLKRVVVIPKFNRSNLEPKKKGRIRKMLCGMFRKKKKTGTPVYVNVYDLMPINRYAYWFGFGFYHSGIQVYGVEYAFGGSDSSRPGIVKLQPKQFQGLPIRRSILIGRTEMSEEECRQFIKNLAKEYPGNSYNIIFRNCNHFTNDVCRKMIKKSIPGWINRLARMNCLYSCLLPDGWNEVPPRPAVVTANHGK